MRMIPTARVRLGVKRARTAPELALGMPPATGVGHRIVAVGAEGLATQDTPGDQQQRLRQRLPIEGLQGVGATGRIEATAARLPRRDEAPVAPHDEFQQQAHAGRLIRLAAVSMGKQRYWDTGTLPPSGLQTTPLQQESPFADQHDRQCQGSDHGRHLLQR